MNKQKFFYLQQKGKIFGPLPASQLLMLYKSNGLNQDDKISFDKHIWKNALEFFNGPAPEIRPDTEPAQENTVPHTPTVEEMLPELCELDIIKEEKPIQIIRMYASMRMFCIIFIILFLLTIISGTLLWLCQPVPNNGQNEEKELKSDSENIFKISRLYEKSTVPQREV